MPLKRCPVCDGEFPVKPSQYSRRECCSVACASELKRTRYAGKGNPNYGNRGECSPLWTGGRVINGAGYVWLYMPEHPMSVGNYVLEHRYVMSQHLGRLLTDNEVVHHKDENRQNNSIENLEVLLLGEHTGLHNRENPVARDTDTGRFTKK